MSSRSTYSDLPLRRAAGGVLAVVLAIVVLPACGGGGGGGGGGPAPTPTPTTPPTVVTRVPASGASGVSRTAVVYVKFSRAMSAASITTSTLTLDDGGAPLAATVDYIPAFFMARLTPTSALAASTLHTVTLTAGITDAGAIPLALQTFTFTTSAASDVTRPTFAGATNTSAATESGMSVNWGAATDADATIVYDVFRSLVSGQFDWSAPFATTAAGATTYPGTGLQSATTYYWAVRARDTSGNTDLNEVQRSGTTLVSFVADLWPIIQSDCRSCHTSGQGSVDVPNMIFTDSASTYAAWVNITPTCATAAQPVRVAPGNVGNSFVYNKLSQAVPSCGSQMPLTGSPLNATELQLFQDWITQGANNN